MNRIHGLSTLTFGAVFAFAVPQRSPAGAAAREMLAAHNAVRARVKVPPLTWSNKLESIARQWAASLISSGKFEHRPDSNYGENLFEIRGSSASPAQVVNSWAGEAADYDAAKNSCRAGAQCGHYTQVVWRDTKQAGCAMARAGTREVWVCEYDPPGNWQGQRPY